MKVFISWSGEYSREVAKKLSLWLPSVIQSVEVFFSPEDIGKGENWDRVLTKELEDCNFGIICLTPENVAAPWIHFEAGSLAKAVDSRVSSIMLGISTSDIKGPLSRFQNTKFEHDDFYRLMCSINNALGKPLREDVLEYSFDTWWNRLEDEVSPIIEKYKTAPKPAEVEKGDKDAIQEILSIVRKISSEGMRNTISSTESDSSSLRQVTVVYGLRILSLISGPLPEELKNIVSKNLEPSESDRVIQELESVGVSRIEAGLNELRKLERELSTIPTIVKTQMFRRRLSA